VYIEMLLFLYLSTR